MNCNRFADQPFLLINHARLLPSRPMNPADAFIFSYVHVMQQLSYCFELCLQLTKSCFCHPHAGSPSSYYTVWSHLRSSVFSQSVSSHRHCLISEITPKLCSQPPRAPTGHLLHVRQLSSLGHKVPSSTATPNTPLQHATSSPTAAPAVFPSPCSHVILLFLAIKGYVKYIFEG